MTAGTGAIDTRLHEAREKLLLLRDTLAGAIVGQHSLIENLICGVFAGGHVLLEGLPGLGKTHLAIGLARSLGVELKRVQCTPDLMPADITGSEVLLDTAAGSRQLDFREGPLFGHLVLVDEINRATPKTQAAMLEAMQEQQVTVLGRSRPLPRPFWVLATQNPIEMEGTYPLPEAQLDRFLFKLLIEPPSTEALLGMLDISLDAEPARQIPPLLTLDDVARIMAAGREILVALPLRQAAVDLVTSTQPHHPHSSSLARDHFRYGAGPRGLQAIVKAARVRALLAGRAHVARADLAAAALPALRHRVLMNMNSEIHGLDIDTLLGRHIAQWADNP